MVLCDKYYIFILFIILGAIGIVWNNISNLIQPKKCKNKTVVKVSEDQIKFNAYLTRFNKSYSGKEYVKRWEYFKKSLEEITFLGSTYGTGAKHGLTKFSDMSQAEFAKLMHNPAYGSECRSLKMDCQYSNTTSGTADLYYSNLVLDSWDWRDHNVVGPVLNQKSCRGCWAFGVVGVMESMEVIQGNRRYTQRSIQELIDCSTYNNGCKGGHVTSALDFLCTKDMGIITQDEYPLKLIKDPCDSNSIEKYKSDGREVSKFWTECNMTEKQMISKIYYHGPLMAVVNAGPWRHYIGGIIRRACYRSLDGNSVDHIVQIVGYNLKSEIPYYIIKNSWGEDFGENGYVKVAIGENLCGISDEVTYLEVKINETRTGLAEYSEIKLIDYL